MHNNLWVAHFIALATIIVWGITFISTKILLAAFSPEVILFSRFLLGWLAIWAMCPQWLPWQGVRQELAFALAGFFGVTLYFLLENIALNYTLTANVSVIVSTAPFFTALVAWLCFQGYKPAFAFYLGFILALIGIGIISWQDSEVHFNPLGDSLALLAALAWAFYSGFVKQLSHLRLGTLKTTRRIFFYGLLLMLPVLYATGWHASPDDFLSAVNLGNFIFLGIGASALCFVAWTFCVSRLGVDKASAYIYLVPVVTVLAAALILHERLTPASILGMALVIIGLFLSEIRIKPRNPVNKSLSLPPDNPHANH